MKKLAIMCVFLSGCSAAYVPVVMQAIDQVAKLVQDRTGKSISDLPMECIIDPVSKGDKEVNVLCTIQLEK